MDPYTLQAAETVLPGVEEGFTLLRDHAVTERQQWAAEKCAREGHADAIDVTPLSSLNYAYACSRYTERWEEERT